jgi:hypothetical protein
MVNLCIILFGADEVDVPHESGDYMSQLAMHVHDLCWFADVIVNSAHFQFQEQPSMDDKFLMSESNILWCFDS